MKEMGGTFFKIERAIESRSCNICKRTIKPEEYHIKFCSNSFYPKNLCQRCLRDRVDELMRKNNTSLLEARVRNK